MGRMISGGLWKVPAGVFAVAICSVLAAFLATALAGEACAAELTPRAGPHVETQATSYDVWVGNKRVTSANANDVLGDGGSVKYSAAKQTLTLKGAHIKKAHRGRSGGGSVVLSGILFNLPSGTFTIDVKGTNKVVVPTATDSSYSYGISEYSDNKAKLKVTGSGKLSVRVGGASITSCGLYVEHAAAVQGSVKLSCTGTDSTRVSCGIASMKKFTIKGSAQVVAAGQTGAFHRAPKFSGYVPVVKAGYSSKSIKVNKKKPSASVYTSNPYVKIVKAASSSTASGKKPAKVSLTKLDRLSGQFLVHWKPLSKNCSGYQLQVSEYKAFPKDLTRFYSLVTDKKYSGAYAWGLTPGTRYYVRVRAYHNVGGKTYWGALSNVKSAVALGGASVG